jgi:segregation and condensation protein B
MSFYQFHIEALIFASKEPISLDDISKTLTSVFDQKFSDEDLLNIIESISQKYLSESYPFEIVNLSDGYSFMTKGAYHLVVGEFLKLNSNKKLTKTALETLSIIAYKQPVAKSEIEQIRGVNADYTIHKLMEKELVEISGRSDGPGRPILYSTSEKFMDYFGLRSIQDLPKLKDLEIEKNTIGEPASLEMHSNSEEE